MQSPVVRPPKGMDWLLGFARRQKVCWCKGQDGCCGRGRLSDTGTQPSAETMGIQCKYPNEQQGLLVLRNATVFLTESDLGNITGAPRSTTRNSNSISYPDQLSLLIFAWCIPAAIYLPKLGAAEPLGKGFPSSTGLEALSQGKTKITRNEHMQIKG